MGEFSAVDDVTSPPGARLRTRGTTLLHLPKVAEARGLLVWGETARHLPFEPKRFFSICDVPRDQVRGGHAHRTLHEFLVCLRGACRIAVDDGVHRDELVLADPSVGLHLEPLVWSAQDRFTPDAVLLVLASEAYRPADRIGDYAEFAALVRGPAAARVDAPLSLLDSR